MSYKKELDYIKSNSYLNDIKLEENKKISEKEIKNFDYYCELKNEITENKEIVKNVSKEEIEKKYQENKGKTEKENEKIFKYLDAFAEIKRLEEELSEMVIDEQKFEFNYQYENLYKIPENFFEIEDFKNKVKKQELDINKLKEINKMLSNSNNPIKMLSKILLMNNEAQIEAIYSYSKNKNLVESFLNNKLAELEEDELNKPLSVTIEEEKNKKRKGLKR